MGINIFATKTWDESLPPLSRYFIAKLNQLVDEDEIVCNRCPVTNGLILLEELCLVARASLRRWKNGHRLKSLLAECSSDVIGLALADDPVVSKHYSVVVETIRNLAADSKDGTNLNPDFAKRTYDKCASFVSAIRPTYTKTILQELLEIDFSAESVRERDTEKIDALLRCLVAQKLYEGYSRGYLQIPAKKMARPARACDRHTDARRPKKTYEKPYDSPNDVVRHLFRFFGGNHTFRIFVEGEIPSFLEFERTEAKCLPRSEFYQFDDDDDDDLDPHEEFESDGSDETETQQDEVTGDESAGPDSAGEDESANQSNDSTDPPAQTTTAEGEAAEVNPDAETANTEPASQTESEGPLSGFEFQVRGKDAFSAYLNFVKATYTNWSLKFPDTARSEVRSLWDNAYYQTRTKFAQFDFQSNSDPNVWSSRKNTLLHTLESLRSFDLSKAPNDLLKELEEPLYFYHQAHSTPFIEGSFIMLWTTLESLASNKTEKADIENIKDLFCRGLAVGSIGRRVNAFVQRMRTTGNANEWGWVGPGEDNTREFSETGLSNWLAWLTAKYDEDSDDDPYTSIKDDELVTKQFLYFNTKWNKLEDLLAVIETSMKRIEFQFDRIYVTRNRLVHSGSFGSGGVTQWSHLEWYVGKLLALALRAGLSARSDSDFEINVRDNLSATLVGHYETSTDYLKRRKAESIKYEFARHSGIFRFPELCF